MALFILVSHRLDVLGNYLASVAIICPCTHLLPDCSRGEVDLELGEAREDRKRRVLNDTLTFKTTGEVGDIVKG